MIELTLYIILNVLGAIFTLLIIAFKQLPAETNKETGQSEGWQGMAFLAAIISTIIWLCIAAASISIGYTQPYTAIDNTTLVTGSYEIVFANTWPLSLIYAMISVLPFVLILFLWPESWKNIGKKE